MMVKCEWPWLDNVDHENQIWCVSIIVHLIGQQYFMQTTVEYHMTQ